MPTCVACTAPLRNNSSVGAERTRYCIAVFWFLSISTLTTFTRPAYSCANCSSIGAIALQGPHHSPQKSTRTGRVDWRTSVLKVESVAELIDISGLHLDVLAIGCVLARMRFPHQLRK